MPITAHFAAELELTSHLGLTLAQVRFLSSGTKKMILVTGSRGLIGSELTRQLKANGQVVRELDIRISPDQDITNPTCLASALEGVTGVVHLAAVSRVADAEEDPDYCYAVNTQATKSILDAARKSGMPWIIFGSSREVYGQPEKLPADEQTTIKPINVYGHSKVQAEAVFADYIQAGGVVSMLRLSNVYGNLSDKQKRVIPAFARAAALGGSLRVEGSNKQFDFTHVKDVVAAMIKTMDQLTTNGETLPPMNIASGRPVSLAQLAQLAQDNSVEPLEVDIQPTQDIFVEAYYSDPAKANGALSWHADIGIEEGFADLVRQYRAAA